MSATTTVILGGGFGGIAAANSLRRLLTAEHEIVVIDEPSRFHVGAGKTWIMLGERIYDQVSQSGEAFSPRAFALSRQSSDIGSRRTHCLGERIAEMGLSGDCARRGCQCGEGARGWRRRHTPSTRSRAHNVKPRWNDLPGARSRYYPKAPFKCPPAPYEAALSCIMRSSAAASRAKPAWRSTPWKGADGDGGSGDGPIYQGRIGAARIAYLRAEVRVAGGGDSTACDL